MKLDVKVKESTMVLAAEETPQQILWVSNMDLVLARSHVLTVYFYRAKSNGFFDTKMLKDALSKTLVPFYPTAGRLKRNAEGRLEIDCNGEGVLFVEAESNVMIDDLGDLKPSLEFKCLVPSVDYTQDITSYPLLLLQITHFKCGGASLGVAAHHILADGISGIHLINYWSEVARGLDPTLQPFIDRTVLRARVPPTPKFSHIEYKPPPTMNPTSAQAQDHKQELSPVGDFFKITRGQLNQLKSNFKDGQNTYSSYVMLAAHVWRCMSKARKLADDQPTKLYIGINGRARLRPPLPSGYFGNVMFTATPMAIVGDLLSNPVTDTAHRIHEALVQMDDEYLKSALDYLELQPDLDKLVRAAGTYRCPNVNIVTWTQLPIYDADFGWGRPIFMCNAAGPREGMAHILPSPTNDGSLSLAISLQVDCMALFKDYLYEI